MDELLVAAQGVAPPVVAAFVLAGGLGRRWTSLAIALGLLVAYVLLKEWPALPGSAGIDGTQWLLWFTAAAAVLATGEAVDAAGVVPRRLALPLGLGLLGVQPWFVLAHLRARWSVSETALHVGAPAVASVALGLALRRIADRRPGLTVPVVWTCALVVDAFVLLQAGTALLGQLAGSVAAGLGAAAFTRLWRRDFALGGAHAVTVVAAHAGLLLAGHHFAYASNPVALVAAAVAPAGLALGTGPGRKSWPGVAASFVAMAVAVAAAAFTGGGKDY